jgi:hypothetical protein
MREKTGGRTAWGLDTMQQNQACEARLYHRTRGASAHDVAWRTRSLACDPDRQKPCITTHATRALAPPEAHCPHSPTHLPSICTSFDPTRTQHTLSSPYPFVHSAPTPPPTQPAHSKAPDTTPGAKDFVSPVLVQLARLCRWRWLPLGPYAGAGHAETTKSEVRWWPRG